MSSFGATKLVAGAGYYKVDDNSRIIQTITFPDGSSSSADLVTDQHQNTDFANLYAYTYTHWPEQVIWTLGMGGERTDVPGDGIPSQRPSSASSIGRWSG